MRGISIFLCACVLFALAASAEASLIGLELTHYPRVASSGILVTYVAPTGGDVYGTLTTAFGETWDLFSDETQTADEVWGAFDLTIQIDPSTGQAVPGSGSLLVADDIAYGSMFASSTILEFGYGGDDIMEFRFVQQGVSGLPNGPQNGDMIGVILSAMSIPDAIFAAPETVPDWLTDFSNNYNGQSDTFFLPEPASLGLLAAGGLALLKRRRS